MPINGEIVGFQKIEGIDDERINDIEKNVLNRLKEKYGEDVPNAITNTIHYIITETYKKSYQFGYNDCLHEKL